MTTSVPRLRQPYRVSADASRSPGGKLNSFVAILVNGVFGSVSSLLFIRKAG
jgi:hypothetical protein